MARWKISILAFIIFWGSVVVAQDPDVFIEDLEIDDASYVNTEELPQTKTPKDSVLGWSWDLPNYRDKYDHLKLALWVEPNNPAELVASYIAGRDRGNSSSHSSVAYGAFRPVALDYGSVVVSLGVSSILIYSYTEAADDVVNQGGIITTTENITSELTGISANFSAFISVPEWSFQIFFDAGYVWQHSRVNIDPIFADANDVLGFTATFDEYQYKQNDEGFVFNLSFVKSYNRYYLNLFALSFFVGISTKTTTRQSNAILTSNIGGGAIITESGKQELPFVDAAGIPFADPQQVDKFDVGLYSATASIRLGTIPIPNAWDERGGVGITLIGGAGHTVGELLGVDFYGVSWKLGGRVSIFEAVSFGFDYVWQENNQLEEKWEFSVTVGLYGLIRDFGSFITNVPGT